MERLERAVKCRETLDLARRIIDGSNPQEEVVHYYPGDNLFTPFERRRGLPLGNQTSQFFANVYLDKLDQFVNRVLRPAVYLRYVDDFLLFGESPDELQERLRQIQTVLAGLRLRVHGGKSQVRPVEAGFTFLGWRLFPGMARLVRGNVLRFTRRMRSLQEDYHEGTIDRAMLRQRVQAWIAHAAHGNTWRLRETVLAGFAFGPVGTGSVQRAGGRLSS